MNDRHELSLISYDVLPSGAILVTFNDLLTFTYVNNLALEQDCVSYDAEVIENLRKYIVCYCASIGSQNLIGKKMVFDLAEPNGNVVRII